MDRYVTTAPLPPERSAWEKADMGNSERPRGQYNPDLQQYEFSDGIVVTDRELQSASEPLIRLYYEKVAAARRVAEAKAEAVIINGMKNGETDWPAIFAANGLDEALVQKTLAKVEERRRAQEAYEERAAKFKAAVEKESKKEFPPEYRADLQKKYDEQALQALANEAARRVVEEGEKRRLNILGAKLGLWGLARFGHHYARGRGAEGLRALGTVGEVMRRAADFNYGGATRGWMLEMD